MSMCQSERKKEEVSKAPLSFYISCKWCMHSLLSTVFDFPPLLPVLIPFPPFLWLHSTQASPLGLRSTSLLLWPWPVHTVSLSLCCTTANSLGNTDLYLHVC